MFRGATVGEFKILTRSSQPELEAAIAIYLKAGWEALGGITIGTTGPNRNAEYSQVLVRRVQPVPSTRTSQ